MSADHLDAPLVLAVSRPGRAVAERLARALGTEVAPDRTGLADAFAHQQPVVAVGALGLWTRILAPHLGDKQHDPAVIVVDDAARFVIPLVGAHHGGNALAERLATHLGATVVITTGTDALGIPSPETLAEDHHWRIEATRDALLCVSAALVNNDPLLIYQDAGDDTAWRATLPPAARMLPTLPDLDRLEAPLLAVTDHCLPALEGTRDRIVLLRPPTLVAGIGASRGAPTEEIEALLLDALTEAGLSTASLAAIATAEIKRHEPGIVEVAQRLGIPMRCFASEELARVPVPTPSAVVEGHVGTPSVSEAAALLASGMTTLLVEKRRSAHATVAIARIAPID